MRRSSFFSFITLLGYAAGEAYKFVLVSSPQDKKVKYAKVDYAGDVGTVYDLIGEGLQVPRGLCIDQARNLLYVVDAPAPPEKSKVIRYELRLNGADLTTAGPGVEAHGDSQARWCAVDGIGDVFLTDEAAQTVLRMPYTLAIGKPLENEVVQTLYGNNSGANTRVSSPGGIAVDNFHVYWSNKVSGDANGSVVRGLELPQAGSEPVSTQLVLAQNAVTTYGVALTQKHVFFANKESKVFGVPKGGGSVIEITSAFTEPRGLAYDGDGTIFVADAKDGGLYSFAGNMHTLEPTLNLMKVAEVNDAYGVAVLQNDALKKFSVSSVFMMALGGAVVFFL